MSLNNSISKEMLADAVQYSADAYADNIPWTTKIECPETSTTAYIIWGDDYHTIAFRGTQQRTDWLFNLWAVPWRYGGRWVHRGWAKAHSSVWEQLMDWIDQFPDKHWLLTGHSLGGALAELSALKLRDTGVGASLITFGKPNTFLKPARTNLSYLDHQISVVSGSDLVARVPRFNYAPDEGQVQLYFDNEREEAWINPSTEFKRKDWRTAQAVSDHSIQLYSRLVNQYVLKAEMQNV